MQSVKLQDINSYNKFIQQTSKITTERFSIKYPQRNSYVRRQTIFPQSMPFPCINQTGIGIGKSYTKPSSVHKLRPGDIDIIAAMGDSLIAGSGALEEWALGNMIEHRGISWCIGGQDTWRTYLTLPNILKEFNPNLTGYSTGTGELLSKNSQLNVAFPVASDDDALKQAKMLVGRMKKLKNINITESWKMITVFFGANDICSSQCFNKEETSPEIHANNLMDALDYLQKHLPRTFVNLIPVIDVTVSVRLKRSIMCRLMHFLYCTCFHRNGGDPMTILPKMTKKYQSAEEKLIASGRYENRDDFTVVLQPFIKFFNAPDDPFRLHDEAIDISYITHDCFHFSQKGHALGANMLWNNLLQPVGFKSTESPNFIMEQFLCPTNKTPYIFTNKNSKTYFSTGFQ
ncbi:hypothetical protein RN001_006201 [Aquatica leii]|uniref:Phospholipase B1, membrane-associated n=1 Tax=Aquatica leii TaxID=1421715 RepID=A0AAN7PD19_9COLE|nr:hypothetical protein RN001_006201 [Aquatica leii]